MNGIMNKLKNTIPSTILKLIYDSFILPHINYCLTLWGYNLTRITKLQKKSIRIICKAKYNAHTDPLFKKMNILKAIDLFHLNCLKIYYNHTQGKTPNFISKLFVVPVHSYNTRYNGLVVQKTNTTSAKKRLKCFVPHLLNTMPDNIISKLSTHSTAGFSKYFKTSTIKQYESRCTLVSCYVCMNVKRPNAPH